MRFNYGADRWGTPRSSSAPHGWVIVKILGFDQNRPVDDGHSTKEEAEEALQEMPDRKDHHIVPATRREIEEINARYENHVNDYWDSDEGEEDE